MARIKFMLNYIVPDTATREEAIEMVKSQIIEDGLASVINNDNVFSFTKKSY